jgi:plastocyanin
MNSVMRRLLGASIGLALMTTTATGAGAMDMVDVSIVDAPRPLPKWGYSPAAQKVEAGTWVTWSNAGGDAHTVTATDQSFDSGNLGPSEGFSWYFEQPGTYTYLCILHPWMKGKVIVTNGVTPFASDDPGEPSEAN